MIPMNLLQKARLAFMRLCGDRGTEPAEYQPITDLTRRSSDGKIQWKFRGEPMLYCAEGECLAMVFPDRLSILLVECFPRHFPHNAIILDWTGVVKLRITNPLADKAAVRFGEPLEALDDCLGLTIECASYQMQCHVNSRGRVYAVREYR